MTITMDVVLDTNAYRRLTYGKPVDKVRSDFAAIIGVEERKGFRAFMAPVPWIELFCHLVDPADPAFDNCLHAVVGSFLHSRIDQRFSRGKLMPNWQLLAAYALFHYDAPAHRQSLYALDDIAAAINASPTKETVEGNRDSLERVKQFSDKHKALFMDSFREKQTEFHDFSQEQKKAIRKDFAAREFEALLPCLYFVLVQGAATAGIDLHSIPYQEHWELLIRIAKLFPAPCYLHKYILEKLMEPCLVKIESNRRYNWYWDYQLLFYISLQTQLILVTGDKEMIDAAKEAGIGDRIFSLEQYVALLELNIPIG